MLPLPCLVVWPAQFRFPLGSVRRELLGGWDAGVCYPRGKGDGGLRHARKTEGGKGTLKVLEAGELIKRNSQQYVEPLTVRLIVQYMRDCNITPLMFFYLQWTSSL